MRRSIQYTNILFLVFTKLASQLSAEKLVELAVIPFIFVVQVLVSYLSALIVSRICKFKKRGKNFVVAMAVSHSLLEISDVEHILTATGFR